MTTRRTTTPEVPAGAGLGVVLVALAGVTARVVWMALRRPSLSLPALALGLLALRGHRHGWLLPATMVVVVAVLLAVWWRLDRATYRQWVGRPVRQWWRRWVRY